MRRRTYIKKKRKVFTGRMRKRLLVLLLLFSMVFVVIVGAIVYYNFVRGDKYSQRVLSQNNYESISVPFKRGNIYDCNGSILATSTKVYNLVLEPKNILSSERAEKATREALNKYFGITADEMNEYLKDSESWYEVVRKKLTYDEVKDFQAYVKTSEGSLVTGVWLQDEYERNYPYKELACHMLGFVVSGNEGIGGLEGGYNSYLNGQNGRTYSYLGKDNNLQKSLEAPVNGDSLVTTIDVETQRIVQKNCEEFEAEMNGAKNISVLVMNPKNCEILALYNSHQFDCNNAYSMVPTKYQFEDAAGMSDEAFKAMADGLSDDEKLKALNELWRNYVVSDNFEPGSTFKPFTISGAMEDGIITGDEQFYCDGVQHIADYDINCHNVYGHGMLSVSEALEYSCNDCLMQIAALEGSTIFDKYQVLYGFGQKTNIDIAGESSDEDLYSLVYHEDTLNPVELATSSFGQGVTVTMMQLGTAFCSVVNGGYYYQPHVVKQILDSDGNVVRSYDKILVRRTISEDTSAKMRQILKEVVEEGTGKKAIVEGYEIGGKTGTAEKIPRGNGKYILSFIGFAPVSDPQVVIYCVVNEPGVADQASSGAGTLLFNKIAEDLLPYMNVYRTGVASETDATMDEVGVPVFDGDAPDVSVAGTTPEENADPNQEEVTEETEETESVYDENYRAPVYDTQSEE
ncbi:MAG TPA: penicillin-binding protein 2 [Lachnospiraceae bacterium]|nr:penicillin-binding protein 2 [Lachnospiraceae bacterium]